MTLIHFVSAFDLLAHQYPSLAFIVELGLKSVIVLICGFIVVGLLANASASAKNFVWRMVFSALFALPFLQGFIPELQIAFNSPASGEDLLLLKTSTDSALWPILYSVLFISYCIVSALLVLRLLIDLYRSDLIVRKASPVESPRIIKLLSNAASQNGSKHSISLLISDSVSSPVTLGFKGHKIIFPPTVTSWDDHLIKQVIGHELGHIQRSDWVQQLASRLVICFFWFNPLIVIAANKMSLEAEKACDDFAIDDTGCCISYAENLLGLAQLLNQKIRKPMVLGLFGAQHVLLQRIAYILTEDKHQHRIDRDSCLPGVLMAVLLAMPISATSVTLEEPRVVKSSNNTRLFAVEYFPRKSPESTLFQRELEQHSTQF